MLQNIKNRGLFTLLFTVFIDLLGVGIVLPIAAPLLILASDGGLIRSAVADVIPPTIILGLYLASYPLAQFFAAPMLGALSDKFGRKPVLTISLIGTGLCYFLSAVAIWNQLLWLFFTARVLDGLTGANLSVAQSAIADVSDSKNKTRNFGFIGIAFGIGFILGPYFGGKLSDPNILSWFNYSTPYLFASLLCLIDLIFVRFFFDETLIIPNSTVKINPLLGFSNLSQAFRSPRMRTLFLTMFFNFLGFGFFINFFQVYLIGRFNFNSSQIGDLFGYIGLWVGLTQGVLAHQLHKRYSTAKILRMSLMSGAIAIAVLMFGPTKEWLWVTLPFVAISQGLGQPNLFTLISNSTENHRQGEVLGISQSVQALATAIPPIIAGFISTISVGLPVTATALCLGAAWLVFFMGYKIPEEVEV